MSQPLLVELAEAIDALLPTVPRAWAGCQPGPACPCHMHDKRRRLDAALAAAREDHSHDTPSERNHAPRTTRS